MFRIRKSEFHFWFSFPNLSPEIAAKSPQKWLKRRKSPQNRRKKTGSKVTQKERPVPALQGTQASAQKGCQGFKPGTTDEGGQLPA